MNHCTPKGIATLMSILFFFMLPNKTKAQTDTTLQYLLDSNYVYLDNEGNIGAQDSSLVDLINTIDSNYIQVDSNGTLITLDSLIIGLLDSNAIADFEPNANFADVLFVDSLGNFVTNDSILQMLLDSSFAYIDSSNNIIITDSTLIDFINGNYMPPDTLVDNILNQDSTLIADGIMGNTEAVNETHDALLENDSTLLEQYNDGIFTVTEDGGLFMDSSSLDIFNGLNLFDIDSSGNISNISEDFPHDEDVEKALMNKFIFKLGYDRTRAEHYNLIFEPQHAYFFSASGLMKKEDDLIGIYYQAGLSATKLENGDTDVLSTTTNNEDVSVQLILADFNVSPFIGFNVGGKYFFTSTGFYSSVLIPKFDHGTAATADNVGNSTAYGNQVMVGAIFDRLFIEFSGRFGKVSKSPYNHKGISGSLDYALTDNLVLHASYKYERFAKDFNKTVSSLRLGIGYGF